MRNRYSVGMDYLESLIIKWNEVKAQLKPTLGFSVKHIEMILISGLIVAAAIQYFVRPQSQSLQQMQESGYMRVLISDEPDSQYILNKQHYGFEYELLAKFAKELDLEMKVEVVPFGELFTLLESGAGDIAVGGILANSYVSEVSQPTISWYQAKTAIVYKRGTERPKSLEQLSNQTVLASARYFGLQGFDGLDLSDDYRSEYDLLSAVANGSERFALSTNYRARNAKHYMPDLNRSFILPTKVDLVWVLPKRHDEGLLNVLNSFLESVVKENLPNQLAEAYLTLPTRLSTFDALSIHKKINTVLPEFEQAFKKAARRNSIDWRMLAALSYQESHWSNAARSPTGVRGIMQLTTETAKFLGVDDRMDMSQSIVAAASYILQLRDRLPERIKEPERTWFAVGAYNVGFKHIMNAYRKAREQGLDRSQWQTIADLLPTLYGKHFSKGVQAKNYVERIQIFTDILRFYDVHQRENMDNEALFAAQSDTES